MGPASLARPARPGRAVPARSGQPHRRSASPRGSGPRARPTDDRALDAPPSRATRRGRPCVAIPPAAITGHPVCVADGPDPSRSGPASVADARDLGEDEPRDAPTPASQGQRVLERQLHRVRAARADPRVRRPRPRPRSGPRTRRPHARSRFRSPSARRTEDDASGSGLDQRVDVAPRDALRRSPAPGRRVAAIARDDVEVASHRPRTRDPCRRHGASRTRLRRRTRPRATRFAVTFASPAPGRAA